MPNPTHKEIWREIIRLRDTIEGQRKENRDTFKDIFGGLSNHAQRITKTETLLKIAGAIVVLAVTAGAFIVMAVA